MRNRLQRSLTTSVFILAVVAALTPDRASASLTVNFGSSTGLLSGDLPSTPGTYVTAVFENSSDNGSIAPDTVRLTITVPTLVSGLFVHELGFNFNTNATPAFAFVSGVATDSPPTFNLGGIAVNGTGNEKFNSNFLYSSSNAGGGVNRLNHPKTSVYDISGLQFGSDLSLLLNPNKTDGYLAAVHIQGYTQGSAGIAGQVSAVPEPATLTLAATFLVPFGVLSLLRSRRRKNGETRRDADMIE